MRSIIRRMFLRLAVATTAVGAAAPQVALASPNPNLSLVPEFGFDDALRLHRLMTYLVPGTDNGVFQDAEAAGVGVYIARLFRNLKLEASRAARLKRRSLYLNVLAALPSGFARSADEEITSVLAANAENEAFAEGLEQIKLDVLSGYFCDEELREGRGASTWRTLQYAPIYPCSDRPDVAERRMLAEPAATVIAHLQRPASRLSDAAKLKLSDVVRRLCSVRS